MTTPAKKPFRKRRLFPRSLQEVVASATKPMMDKQGKLYGALLRDWPQIVGEARAQTTRPQRLQFAKAENSGAVLHLDVRPAAAPEMAYAEQQILEQCARYFGYRAITRIVVHATHGVFSDAPATPAQKKSPASQAPIQQAVPNEMRGVLERIAAHIASASDKKN